VALLSARRKRERKRARGKRNDGLLFKQLCVRIAQRADAIDSDVATSGADAPHADAAVLTPSRKEMNVFFPVSATAAAAAAASITIAPRVYFRQPRDRPHRIAV
jgi:hypothetical protein